MLLCVGVGVLLLLCGGMCCAQLLFVVVCGCVLRIAVDVVDYMLLSLLLIIDNVVVCSCFGVARLLLLCC